MIVEGLCSSRTISTGLADTCPQQDWAEEFKGLKICRIDGSTSQESRREQMNEFNNGGDDPEACKLFLLSTRAGGLGVNLVAAE